MTVPSEAVHTEPVWRDRSNFIIGALLADAGPGEFESEQLWARDVGDGMYEICCIPFFVYDLALADLVRVDADYNLVSVAVRSGRVPFRVFASDPSVIRRVQSTVADLGGLSERFSPDLLAADAPDQATAQRIADFLAAQEAAGSLHFETGHIA